MYKFSRTIRYHKQAIFEVVVVNNIIITASQDKTIQIFDYKTGKRKGEIVGAHEEPVRFIVGYSQKLCISGGSDGYLNLINIKSRKIIKKLKLGDEIYNIKLSKRGQKPLIVTDKGERSLIVFSFPSFKTVKEIRNAHNQYLIDMVLFNGGKQLITSGNDNYIKIWNLTDKLKIQNGNLPDQGPVVQIQTEHQAWIRSLCLTKCETKLLSGDEFGTLILTNIQGLQWKNRKGPIIPQKSYYQIWKMDTQVPDQNLNFSSQENQETEEKQSQQVLNTQNNIYSSNPNNNNQKIECQLQVQLISNLNTNNNKQNSITQFNDQTQESNNEQNISILNQNIQPLKAFNNNINREQQQNQQQQQNDIIYISDEEEVEIEEQKQYQFQNDQKNLQNSYIYNTPTHINTTFTVSKISCSTCNTANTVTQTLQNSVILQSEHSNPPPNNNLFVSSLSVQSANPRHNLQQQEEEEEEYRLPHFNQGSQFKSMLQEPSTTASRNLLQTQSTQLTQTFNNQQYINNDNTSQNQNQISDFLSQQQQNQQYQQQRNNLILIDDDSEDQGQQGDQSSDSPSSCSEQQSNSHQNQSDLDQFSQYEEETEELHTVTITPYEDFHIQFQNQNSNSSLYSDSDSSSLVEEDQEQEQENLSQNMQQSQQINIESRFARIQRILQQKDEHKIYKIKITQDNKYALVGKRYGVLQFIPLDKGRGMVESEIKQYGDGLYSFSMTKNTSYIFTTSHMNSKVQVYKKFKQL